MSSRKVSRVCQFCNISFEVLPYQLKKGWGIYCSQSCSNEGRKKRINSNCLNCGKEFENKLCRAEEGRGIFCSKSCKHAFGRKDVTCKVCGKDVVITKSKYKIDNTEHCSRKCAGVSKRLKNVEFYFLGNVLIPSDFEGCWIWKGSKSRAGYGRIRFTNASGKKESILAHRYSYQLWYGQIPDGLHGCHHCDNPICVRPDHIFLGTDRDNIEDKVKKGRHCYGEKCSFAKLSEKDVLNIRKMYESGVCRQWQIAEKFGISTRYVSDIVTRKRWKHLL